MKELAKIYGLLLQDKRVKFEQVKYEGFTRQRNSVLTKYKKVFQAFNDLVHGLMNAQSFYSEMRDTVDSLEKNVETFVSNRRSEGAQLLHRIEQDKASSAGGQADRERDRLQQLMERMSVDSSSTASPTRLATSRTAPRPSQSNELYFSKSPPTSLPHYSNPTSTSTNGQSGLKSPDTPALYHKYVQSPSTEQIHQIPATQESHSIAATSGTNDPYNPMVYPYQSPTYLPQTQPSHQNQPYPQQGSQHLPQGYVPPPPPPGPPPKSQGNYGNSGYPYPSGPGGYAQSLRKSSAGQAQNDPWAGLNVWK